MELIDGLPKENGASDKQDSARLAAILVTFGCPENIDLLRYFKLIDHTFGTQNIFYVRHPDEYIYDFSRDQAICFMAGLATLGYNDLVGQIWINGKDLMSPGVRGHIARCRGEKATTFQNLWLLAEAYYHATQTPLEEPNQLFCMLKIAGPDFIRFYCALNPQWEQAIKNYWCENDGAWRNEPEVATWMIQSIRGDLYRGLNNC